MQRACHQHTDTDQPMEHDYSFVRAMREIGNEILLRRERYQESELSDSQVPRPKCHCFPKYRHVCPNIAQQQAQEYRYVYSTDHHVPSCRQSSEIWYPQLNIRCLAKKRHDCVCPCRRCRIGGRSSFRAFAKRRGELERPGHYTNHGETGCHDVPKDICVSLIAVRRGTHGERLHGVVHHSIHDYRCSHLRGLVPGHVGTQGRVTGAFIEKNRDYERDLFPNSGLIPQFAQDMSDRSCGSGSCASAPNEWKCLGTHKP